MASVDYQRDDYQYSLKDWVFVDDITAGERKVKAKARQYLPQPNPSDESAENQTRYLQYLARAVFYNATARTLDGLIGTAFKRQPESELQGIDYLENDIDGQGVGLFQQAQNTVEVVLKHGRRALMVDFPKTNGAISVAGMATGNIRATIVSIDAAQVINWRKTRFGAEHKLSLVVIHERVEVPGDDGYSFDIEDQYRVLKLGNTMIVGGAIVETMSPVYSVEVHRKTKAGFELDEAYTPLDGTGKPWDTIPFTFVGAQDNNETIDKAPLLDMATLNIAHYRNSADYEDSAYFVGQAQPWMAGLTEEWRDEMLKRGVYIGSRAPIMLPEGGQFGIAQAEPNTLVKEAMDQKEQQMIALGARLVQRGQAIKTATEAQSDIEAEHSVLSLVVENVSEAYSSALGWVARFMNVSGEHFLKIEQDFSDTSADPLMINALQALFQGGSLPESDMFAYLRRVGVIDSAKTDEEIQEEIDSSPVGLGLEDVSNG